MTNFEEHLAQIQEDFFKKTFEVHKDVINTALAFLREDFMSRANQIGIALFRSGLFSLAEEMYRLLAKQTLQYRETTGNWRHIGALYANIAGACAAQGNIDQAVIELLRAAEDDVHTYGVIKSDSFALTGLLEAYFARPVKVEALKIVQTINSTITETDISNLSKNFGDQEYAFLAYLRLGIVHIESNQAFANEYSNLQLFSSLRNLSSLLEILLKTLTGQMHNTLFPTLRILYGMKPWWSTFEATRIAIGAGQNQAVLVDDQLKNAIAIPASDDLTNFWKGLIITYIVRNFTIHNLEPKSDLITVYPKQVLGYILNTMMYSKTYM
jgi:hypothetical protein